MVDEMKLPEELMFIINRNAEQKKSNISMKDKICIITGATSGVGLETLKRFAEGGSHAVIVCRNYEKAETVKQEIKCKWNTPVDIVIADFKRLSDVRAAAETILKKYPRIDVLINNAGMHSTKLTFTPEGIETVYCVNHLASFLFTMLLLERMKESAPSRILQVNSEGHRFSRADPEDINWRKRHYTGLRSYGASKTAQLHTVRHIAHLLEGTGVTINAVHPGDVKSNIGSNNGLIYRLFSRFFTSHFLKDPSISGDALYFLATDPSLNDISGRFFHLTIEEKPARHALDEETGKRIWEQSMKMTGL